MDLTFRYNPEKDDVEILLGEDVIDTVGEDVFASWVGAYNSKHGYVERVQIEQETKTDETENEETGTEEKVDDSAKDD